MMGEVLEGTAIVAVIIGGLIWMAWGVVCGVFVVVSAVQAIWRRE